METIIFLLTGSLVVAAFYGIGELILAAFGFDRAKAWGRLADYAYANERAALHRVEVRKSRPWRAWEAA